MYKKGTRLLWVSKNVPGEIVRGGDDYFTVEWEAGHDSPVSGYTLGTYAEWIEEGIIALLDEPEPELVPSGLAPRADLFEQVFHLSFEV